MNYAIPATLLSLSFFTTSVGFILSVDAIAKIPNKPQQVEQPKTPQEFSSLISRDGKRWGIIKLWGYKYNPQIPPNTDLKIVLSNLNSQDFLLLESDENSPVWGYYLSRRTGLIPQPVTDALVNNYQEIFNPEEFN